MLIEILDSPVMVDKQPLLKGIRLNIAGNNQYRIKTTVLNDGNDIPVDLIIYQLAWKGIKNLTANIDINAVEKNTNIRVDVKVSYSIHRKEYSIKGIIGDEQINIKTKNMQEIISSIINIVTQVIKNKK